MQFDSSTYSQFLDSKKEEVDGSDRGYIIIPSLKENVVRLAKPQVKKRINLRVHGHLFQTFEETLEAFPKTLLGKYSERKKYYNAERDEFIFERCYFSFDAILFYYQSHGILSKPASVTREQFLEELEFFQITDCFDMRHRTEMAFAEKERKTMESPSTKYQKFIWRTICFRNDPRVWNFPYVFYASNVILSFFSICLEPSFNSRQLWCTLEAFSTLFFTIEFFIQLYISKDRKQYSLSPFGILDILTMVSSHLSLYSYILPDDKFVAFTKYFRLARLFKCTRISRGVQEFVHVFYACREQLASFFVTVALSCIICAALVQSFEEHLGGTTKVDFMSWVWYSFITASGVGYGDIYPKSIAGKICGASLSIAGVVIFCLPASQIISKFVELYYLPDILGQSMDVKKKKLISHARNIFLGDVEKFAKS